MNKNFTTRYFNLNGIKRHYCAITLLTLASITVLSLYPLDKLPDVPGKDKTHHFIAYAILSFPVALRKPKGCIYFMVFFVFYGGLIEIIQPYVNRYAEWLDMFANTTGVVFGAIAAKIVTKTTSKGV